MKTGIIILCAAFIGTATLSSCKQDVRGVCRCKYLSGDINEHDFTNLTIAEAKAKCDTMDQNAEAFAGDCRLE